MNIPNFKGKKILVVEDDPVSMELLNELLAQTNATIIYADNGKSAVELFTENMDTHLILMDIQLPLLSGTDAMMQIKEVNPEVKVIAQTAFAMSSDRKKYLTSGFDDYLSKPVLPDSLYQLLSNYLA